MKNFNSIVLGLALLISSSCILAADMPSPGKISVDMSIISLVTGAIGAAASALTAQAIIWLAAFASLQIVITNFGLLKSGADIEAIFGKLIGSLLWVGFCIYLLDEGPAFIQKVGIQFFDMSPGLTTLSPGWLMTTGLAVGTTAIVTAGGVSAIPAGIGTGPGLILFVISLPLLIVPLFLALKILMLQIELALIVMLAPLSFAFLGLSALKDQGIAPFKSLIALGYRILLLGVIMVAFKEVHTEAGKILTNYNAFDWDVILNGIGNLVQTLGSMVAAYITLAFLAWKSDAIAASLASGSVNLGTADIAGAAAAGATAGALAGAAISKVAGPNGPKSMADVIASMGGGGSVSNASPMGSMQNIAPPPPKPVSANTSLPPPPPSGNKSASPSPQKAGEDGGGAPPASSAAQGADNVAKAQPTGGSGQSDSGQSSATPDAGSSAPGGNGSTAGIGAGSGGLEKAVGDLVAAMNQPKKPGFNERLSNMNRQIEQEKATTSVSINTHPSD